MFFLFNWVMFSSHVNFQGCTHNTTLQHFRKLTWKRLDLPSLPSSERIEAKRWAIPAAKYDQKGHYLKAKFGIGTTKHDGIQTLPTW